MVCFLPDVRHIVLAMHTQGPHSYILLMGVGEGGVTRDFLGSEILAKRDFFGSVKDTGIFWVPKKTQGFF